MTITRKSFISVYQFCRLPKVGTECGKCLFSPILNFPFTRVQISLNQAMQTANLLSINQTANVEQNIGVEVLRKKGPQGFIEHSFFFLLGPFCFFEKQLGSTGLPLELTASCSISFGMSPITINIFKLPSLNKIDFLVIMPGKKTKKTVQKPKKQLKSKINKAKKTAVVKKRPKPRPGLRSRKEPDPTDFRPSWDYGCEDKRVYGEPSASRSATATTSANELPKRCKTCEFIRGMEETGPCSAVSLATPHPSSSTRVKKLFVINKF